MHGGTRAGGELENSKWTRSWGSERFPGGIRWGCGTEPVESGRYLADFVAARLNSPRPPVATGRLPRLRAAPVRLLEPALRGRSHITSDAFANPSALRPIPTRPAPALCLGRGACEEESRCLLGMVRSRQHKVAKSKLLFLFCSRGGTLAWRIYPGL